MKDNPLVYNDYTVPQKHADDRVIMCAGGNLLSGSSSVNSCMWTRGHSADWDKWAKDVGDPRWSYESMLPYFKRSETYHDGNKNPDIHGYEGPIKTVCKVHYF